MSGGGARKRRTDTRDPRRSRARALKLLYQADVRGEDPVALLERVVADPRAAALLDDLDPDEAAEIASALPADHPDADPEHPRVTAARAGNTPPIDGFTRSLVNGVSERRTELDAHVQRFARRWATSRMPAVDRNALRLGAYELAHETTSPAVVINEMVELVKGLSTDDSGRYVNGVLEAIRKDLAATATAAPSEPAPAPEPESEPASPGEEAAPPGTGEASTDPVEVLADAELIEAAVPPEEAPAEDDAAPGESSGEAPSDAAAPDGDASAQQQLF